MKFVFINPGRKISKRNIWSAINSVTPPLGLATLAAVVEARGHEAEVIDAYALGLSIEEIVKRVDPKADYLGLTATTPEVNFIIATAEELRRALPGKPIVFGGVHPTVFHKELVEGGACDMVVRGEGEAALAALAEGKPLGEIASLTWKSESGVTVNPMSTEYADLDALPFPSYHLLPMELYRSALGAAKLSPSIGMITSRGCPGKCTFCYSGMFGSRIRMMSAPRVMEHIKFLRDRYGIREVSFYDDTFTTNKKRVEALCEAMLKEDMRLSWSCFARVDTVSPELLKRMKAAGCHQVQYGIESPDEEILKNINKKVTGRSIETAMAWTREAGIDVRGALMLGNEGETVETMQHTIDYALRADLQFAIFNITTPYPGTALYEWAMERGYLRTLDWDEYDLSHPILELPTVSGEAVLAAYRESYRRYYIRPSYMVRRLLSLRTWHDIKTHAQALWGIVLAAVGRG